MTNAYRKKLLQMTDEAALDGNTMLADGLKLLVKTYNDIDECEKAEKKAAQRKSYIDAIKLIGMVDAFKKVSWDLEKVFNLR